MDGLRCLWLSATDYGFSIEVVAGFQVLSAVHECHGQLDFWEKTKDRWVVVVLAAIASVIVFGNTSRLIED